MFKMFLALTANMEGMAIPKRHVMMHVLDDMHKFGNPKTYANWLNESMNKVLRKCCRQVSQCTFDTAVLSGFRELHKRRSTKRKLD